MVNPAVFNPSRALIVFKAWQSPTSIRELMLRREKSDALLTRREVITGHHKKVLFSFQKHQNEIYIQFEMNRDEMWHF